MITGIDHIALAVRDLDRAAADYEGLLGRTADWRGEMEGARHAWFQLTNLGLDLIAPLGPGRFGERVAKRLDTAGEGVWGLGLQTANLDAACRTLTRHAVQIAERTELHSTNRNGEKRGWSFANLSHDASGGLAIFVVQKREDWPYAPRDSADSISELDHVVINTANPDRAAAFYGARLGLDLRLDRSNPQWGSRLLFFRCGNAVVEIGARLEAHVSDTPDRFGGLAWRVRDAGAVHARLGAVGFDVSELRKGRKPGTSVFTVRGRTASVPTLMLEASSRD